MNMRTTLMLMAASIAPIYAQEPADSAAQVFSRLATPASATTATAAQRAAVYPGLAYIPAQVEAFVTLNDLAPLGELISDMTGDTAQPWMSALQGLTIAVGPGLADMLKQTEPWSITSSLEECDNCKPLVQTLADPASAIMTKLLDAYKDNAKKAALANMPNIKLPAIYAVLNGTPESEAMLSSWLELAMGTFENGANESNEDETEYVEINGYRGLKIQLKGKTFISSPYEYNEETGEVVQVPLTPEQQAASDEIDKRTIYVLLKQQGCALIGVVCEDTAALALPATAEESVLATDKLAKADANLSNSPIFLGWGDAAITTNMNATRVAPYIGLTKLAGQAFAELAAAGDAQAPTWQAAANGTQVIADTIAKLTIPQPTTPDTMQVWKTEGYVNVEYSSNANGISYKSGSLNLTSLAQKPNTIVYLASTDYSNANTIDCGQLVDAVVNVATGYAAAAQNSEMMSAQLEMAKAFVPDVKNLCAAFGTIGSGLDKNTVLTIDSAGSMPAILGGRPGNTTAIPRIAFYAPVTDRAKLNEGWQAIVKTASEIATKVGSDPSIVNMLPIVPKAEGNATTYSVHMPWFTPDMVPSITVSDTAFAAGTSSTLNEELVATATGSLPFAGSVFSIQFQPLATTARGIADALAAEAKADDEPLSLGVEGEVKDDTEVAVVEADTDEEDTDSDSDDYIEEEDYEESDYHSYKAPTPAEERAEQADNIADACEAAAKYIERLDGTVTTEGDTATIRMQIKLKK